MKVVLIRPPKYIIEGAYVYPPLPPLGIALIAGTLKAAGHFVKCIDGFGEAPQQFVTDEDIPVYSDRVLSNYRLIANGLSFQEIADRIPANVDVIGISAMFSINWPLDRALIKFLAKKFPKAKIIAGGESITGMAETCLKQVDSLYACVLGEGEETIIDLLNAIAQNRTLHSVDGIAFKDENGKVIKTSPRKRIRKIDDIPFPDWSDLPVYNYQKFVVVPNEKPRISLAVLATRGCPYECTFCTSPDMWGTRYFMRSPDNVIAEIEYMKETYGATHFEFYDLTAIIQKKWIVEFAQKIVEKNLKITWKIPGGTRSEAIDEEVAYWLKNSGCYFITYAPESGSPRLLKKIKKKVHLPSILRSVRDSKKQGMIVYLNMILGLPEETHLDIWKTMWFLFKCKLNGVDDVPIAFYRPYPGSHLFNELLKEGQITLDNDDFLIDSLFLIDTLINHQNYNKNVSDFWYKIYKPLVYFSFYGVDYIINPGKILRTLRNISEKNYESEMERKLAFK
ncbi:MAG: radical SAM protein [Chitinophagales bacterium]|nr:radical SAM protein [Chitinophagales bacterium]